MTSTIMVVDDDPNVRWTLQEILRDEGLDVITAEDGLQAVQLASESQIALILMDVQMPGMSGIDALIKIKETRPDCTVVIMTGHASDAILAKAFSEGAMTCLNKPISIGQILKIVGQVLETSEEGQRPVFDDSPSLSRWRTSTAESI